MGSSDAVSGVGLGDGGGGAGAHAAAARANLLQPESIKVIADTVGISNLSGDIAAALAILDMRCCFQPGDHVDYDALTAAVLKVS